MSFIYLVKELVSFNNLLYLVADIFSSILPLSNLLILLQVSADNFKLTSSSIVEGERLAVDI